MQRNFMKKITFLLMAMATTGALAQATYSAGSLLPSTTVVTGIAAVSAPLVLLTVLAAGIDDTVDSVAPPQTTTATSSTAGR